jgi:hypothetical protein
MPPAPVSTAFERILYRLLAITEVLLGFSGNLFSKPLGLLTLASNQFARSFLNLSRDVLGSALDLVFVHFQRSLLVDYTDRTTDVMRRRRRFATVSPAIQV